MKHFFHRGPGFAFCCSIWKRYLRWCCFLPPALGGGIGSHFFHVPGKIIAGIFESKKNNTFGMTAFISYGSFWLTLVALLVMPKLGWIEATSKPALASYLLLWGIFTFLLFIGTLKLTKALQFVFATLTILFFLLAIADFTGNASITKFAGYEGLICGGSAIYTGIASLLNEVYGRKVLPIG